MENEPMDELKDLTSVNIMMQKQQLIETQLAVKTRYIIPSFLYNNLLKFSEKGFLYTYSRSVGTLN